MTTYAPTKKPGETRRRMRYLGIWTPLDTRTDEEKANEISAPMPVIEVLEQDAVRLADREAVLSDLGALPVGAFDLSEVFPLRDAQDRLTGETSTVADLEQRLRSWVRQKQTQRDENPLSTPNESHA